MRRALNRPTDVELSILRVLWEVGPATVREVHARLVEERGEDLAYTAVLKMMQTMAEKGLLRRDASDRAHRYEPAQARERTLAHLVDDLLQRAFGGRTLDLFATALASDRLSDTERSEVARLLAQARKEAP